MAITQVWQERDAGDTGTFEVTRITWPHPQYVIWRGAGWYATIMIEQGLLTSLASTDEVEARELVCDTFGEHSLQYVASVVEFGVNSGVRIMQG